VKVATWNVRHGRPRRGFTSNRRLAAAVTSLDVDVLAVQEIERRVVRSWFVDQPALVARALHASTYEYAPARRLAIIGTDGIALCVRGAATFRTVNLPHQWGQRRVAIVADVDGVSVVATHLQNEEGEARMQLAWLVEELGPPDGPRIVLGDLNLRPNDVAAILEPAGYVLAGGGLSNPADHPIQQIDHIAVAGLTVESVMVGAAPVSDHLPLLAVVS